MRRCSRPAIVFRVVRHREDAARRARSIPRCIADLHAGSAVDRSRNRAHVRVDLGDQSALYLDPHVEAPRLGVTAGIAYQSIGQNLDVLEDGSGALCRG